MTTKSHYDDNEVRSQVIPPLSFRLYLIEFNFVYFTGAVLIHKPLRNLKNAFIINLAVADLMVSSVINPFSILGGIKGGDFFFRYPIICEIIASMCIISCTCSVWNIAAISVNRYVCICHHFIYHDMYNKSTMPFYILGLWFVCSLVDLPCFLGWGDHAFDTRALLCAFSYLYSYSYSIYLITCGFWLPMFLTSVCYYRILSYVRSVKKDLKKSQSSTKHANQDDFKILRSIGTIWVVFMLMWTPFTIIVFFDRYGEWPQSFYIMAIAFAHANSSINCIIYAATNKNFREGYIIFLRCCFPSTTEVSLQSSSM